MSEMSEAQNKMISEKLGAFIKDYIGENGCKPSTLNCVRWAYKQGLSDPSRSEALDKVLDEVEEALDIILMNNHASTLRFSDIGCLALLKLRELRGGK